jgi:hypothetical protein
MMDDIEDRKTYVAEYFSWKVPRHGEAVFTKLEDAEKLLFKVYVEITPYLRPAERKAGWVNGRLQTDLLFFRSVGGSRPSRVHR